MTGDERAKHCAICNKLVHNLSVMTFDEARNILKRGKVCVRCTVDGRGDVVTTDYEQIREQKLVLLQASIAVCILLGASGAAKPLLSASADLIAAPFSMFTVMGESKADSERWHRKYEAERMAREAQETLQKKEEVKAKHSKAAKRGQQHPGA